MGDDQVRQQRDALDVLIDQERKLLELYDARAANAEARGAASLTAATAVAVLTVTVANSGQHLTRVLAALALVALAVVVAVAVLARSGAGVKLSFSRRRRAKPESTRAPQSQPGTHRELNREPWLSVESSQYRSALRAMRTFEQRLLTGAGFDATEATAARLHALALWNARAENAHLLAQKRDVWSGVAGLLLVVALVLLAVSQAIAVLS